MDDILGLSRAKPDGSAQRIKDLVRGRMGLGDDDYRPLGSVRLNSSEVGRAWPLGE